MKLLLKATLATAMTITILQPAHAQSFSCNAARTSTERTICANDRLRKIDEQMAIEYGYARRFRRSARDEARLLKDQRAWLRRRNRCGRRISCLDRAYR